MMHQIVIAGFGGQGIMTMGQFLAYAGMLEGKAVSWLPSYGPEMRGGTANCHVIISSEGAVGSPIVTDATAVIVMNRPSLAKFEPLTIPGGLLLINASLITDKSRREDIEVLYIPANEIADELKDTRVANMVMLGGVSETDGGGFASVHRGGDEKGIRREESRFDPPQYGGAQKRRGLRSGIGTVPLRHRMSGVFLYGPWGMYNIRAPGGPDALIGLFSPF